MEQFRNLRCDLLDITRRAIPINSNIVSPKIYVARIAILLFLQ